MTTDQWSSLDGAADANLGDSPATIQRFQEYRDQLRADGHAWCDDAEDILRGFIWDESEDPAEND